MGPQQTQPIGLVLSDDEREALERWARRPKRAQALASRCRIVLACAKGGNNTEVASCLVSVVTPWASGIGDSWNTGSMASTTIPVRALPDRPVTTPSKR
jgi:hypothetical protein